MENASPDAEPRLTLVLPAYNEEASLAGSLRLCTESLDRAGLADHEIIVVNDGSTDRTGELAEAQAARDPRVRVIHHAANRGQSAAFLHGFARARGRVVGWNGMDLPFHPGEIPRVLALIDAGADVVVVQRRDRSAYGLLRRIISRANVWTLKLLFASPLNDHNFVQFFRREVLGALPVRSRGVSTVTAELIFRARGAGRRVATMTADYHPRRAGSSTISAGKVLHTILETLRLRWILWCERIRPPAAPPRPAGGPAT